MRTDCDFFREKVKTELYSYPAPDRPLFIMKAKHNSGTGSAQTITMMLGQQEAEALRKKLDEFLARFQ